MFFLRTLTRILSTLQDILHELRQIHDLLNPGPAVKLIFTARMEDGTTQTGVTMLTIRDDQKTTLSIEPLDAKGKPALLDGAPVWAGSDDTVFTLVPASDGLSAVLSAVAPNPTDPTTGAPIPARVVVTADADLGSGVTPLTGTLDVVVTGGQAVTLTINAAPPANQ